MSLEYPKGFPPDCQTLVEVEKIRADRDFGRAEQTQRLSLPEFEQRALRWVCRVLGAFAHQACELGKKGQWTLMQIAPAVEEFRLLLIRTVSYSMSDGRLTWVDRVFGTSILPEVRHRIESSVEWQRYQDELLEMADAFTRVQGPSAERDPTENCGGAGPPAAAGLPEAESTDETASRQLRLDQFRTKYGATNADIRRSASVYKPDFQLWRAGKLGGESVMARRIEAVLSGKRALIKRPRNNGIE